MTEEERKQIQDLRLKGAGYKSIAAVVGVTRDTLRGYCKRSGLGGDSKVVALNVEERIKNQLDCPCCGQAIKKNAKGRSRRFCSTECCRKWWVENYDARIKREEFIYHFVCGCCGKNFSAYGHKHRKYCSPGCYFKARFGGEEIGIQETADWRADPGQLQSAQEAQAR